MDEDERKRRAKEANTEFMKRLREHDPHRARLYCDHGKYIGFGGLFRNKCNYCMGEEW